MDTQKPINKEIPNDGRAVILPEDDRAKEEADDRASTETTEDNDDRVSG